jgi:ATP-binding cassette, subfamily C, bacterial
MDNTFPSQKRIKTPTILQMEATECGSTSLAIILAYYGKYITSEEARTACGVSRDGTKAIHIVKAARNYGMQATGANLDIAQLQEKQVPFIAYWGFDHFLIIEGFSKSRVYLNDPAVGPRHVTWEEFKEKYTGVVLVLRPGPTFQPGGQPEPSTLKLLINRMGNNFYPLLFLVLITILLIIPKIAMPIFTKGFIDQVLINNQSNLLLFVLSGLAFTTALAMLLTAIQRNILYKLDIKLDTVNSIKFLWHLLHIPIRYFQQRSNGDIVERNNISEKIASYIAEDLPITLVNILEIIAFSAVIILLSWQIGLILFISMIINIIALEYGRIALTDTGRRYAQDRGKLEAIETNGIQIIETLKASGLEAFFFSRWVAFYTRFLLTEQRLLWLNTLLNFIPGILAFFVGIAMICYGAYLVMSGELTVGTIIAIQALSVSILAPLNHLIEFISGLFQLKGDLIRLSDVTDTDIDPFFNKSAVSTPLNPLKSDIILQMNKLSFSYSPLEPPVINNLSLTMNKGERIAIVGPSGSGKSSLAKLVCALNLPNQGELYFDSRPYHQLNRELLSQYISYVDQQIFLFAGSIRDNLTLWDNSISDEKIYEALRKTGMADDVILRGGLKAHLIDKGANFSGGQCQRLEIARALLKNAPLLVFDEATSAIDPLVEAEIYAYLKTIESSVFIIAHRLSAIKDCDRIYVLKEGQIIQQGSHNELIVQEGLYQELVGMEQL